VRNKHVLSLEDAIRKMTSWPAARMGLSDRGVLREGLRADVVVFNYERIRDMADWTHPQAAPAGIDAVVVNGQIAIDRGTYTGAKSGVVLRHRCPAP
jgi:N-acyl-D-amino-acid deacylase